MLDDYLNGLAAARSRDRAARLAAIRAPAGLPDWQDEVRQRLGAVLVGYPERTPLRPRIVATIPRPGYTVEKLIYESRPQTYVTANVYVPGAAADAGSGAPPGGHVPDGAPPGKPPWPAVVVSCGHTEADGKADPSYQALCIAFARRGCLALILDPWGQGERRQYWDPAAGAGAVPHEHLYATYQALLVGESFARYRVWDKVRAIDYLCSRPDVDPERLGCAGHSGGGAMATLMAAVDPRLQVVATSGAGGPCEWAQLPPGSRYSVHVDDGVADCLSLFAPQPLLMVCGEADRPRTDWLRPAAAQLERLYGAIGAGDRFRYVETPGGHPLDAPKRALIVAWFDRWLKPDGRSGQGAAPADAAGAPDERDERDALPAAELSCTPTGHVATSLGGETLASLIGETARRLARRREDHRRGAWPAAVIDGSYTREVTARLRRLLGWATPPPSPPAVLSREALALVGAERLLLESEPGIELPALLLRPADGAGAPADPSASPPLVIWLDDRGTAAILRPTGSEASGEPDLASLHRRRESGTSLLNRRSVAAALLGAGATVLAVDVRGLGATRTREIETGDATGLRRYLAPLGTDAANGLRSIVLGRPLVGMRAFDALRAAAYIRAQPALARSPVVLAGYGVGATVALLAAALDERIACVATWHGLATYDSIARHRYYGHGAGLFVDGLLAKLDLPDVIAAIVPRPVLLIDPLDHRGVPLTACAAGRAFAWLATVAELHALRAMPYTVARAAAGAAQALRQDAETDVDQAAAPARAGRLTLVHTPPGSDAHGLAALLTWLRTV